MILVLSKIASSGYSYVAKPVLFRLSPDFVHESMIRVAHVLQKFRFVRQIVNYALAYEDDVLKTTVAGIDFINPLGLSAGLDKDAKIVPFVKSIGFGFIECGSVTFEPYTGNKKPWYTRLPKSKSIIVNSGLKSDGAKKVIERVNKYNRNVFSSFPLNVSIAKTNSEKTCTLDEGVADYVSSFKLWEKGGNARYYTVNISCPNTFGGEPYTTPETLEKLLSALDALKIKKPIFVKFPIDKSWKETRALLVVCSKHSVQGITFGNLYKDRTTVKLQEPYDKKVKGNFSGKPCFEKSNELLAKAYRDFSDRFVFSGVGGVFTAEDAYTKIRLGASLVEFITGLIFQGPAVVGQMNKQLAELLRRDGFEHVSEAVGVDVIVKGDKK